MLTLQKRKCACLIPYKVSDGQVLIYLQKRGKDAQKAPGKFGFFGGGLENNETAEEGLLREIKEELDFVPKDFWYLGDYEFARKELITFCLKVGESFEKEIKVLEGDYGKWFSERDIFSLQDFNKEFIDDDKPVIIDFFRKIKKEMGP